MAKIDVIMTCYNEGPYINEAVCSILQQTRVDIIERIIIVDDGSDKPTLDILNDLKGKDSRIVLYKGESRGPAAARNLAAAHSSADWIAMLDGDDLWEPDKIEAQVSLIESDAELGFVYTGLAYFSDSNQTPQVAAVADLSKETDLEKAYFLKDGPITSTIIVKRSLFEKVDGYNETLRVFEDTDFYARLAAETRFGFLKNPLVNKRQHTSSITAKRKEMIAHQAFVATLIAARSPRLIPLLPRRLSRAAMKLGNSSISVGDKESALSMYRLSLAFNPLSLSAWSLLIALHFNIPLGAIRKKIINRRKTVSHEL